MKKIFTLMAVAAFATSASAVTPFKNLYVEAYATPTGAGSVYINPKNDEDAQYVFEQSEDWGDSAFMKYVGGENGNGDDVQGFNKPADPASPNGTFEAKIKVEPEAGWELVCYAGAVYEDGIYGVSDVFPTFTGENQSSRQWSFEWPGSEDAMVNVNNVDCPQTGASDGNPRTRDDCFADPSLWNEEPDTKIYVIFRRVGEELPKFDPEYEGHNATGVNAVNKITVSDGKIYNAAGQQVGKVENGLIIRDGKKVIVK